jgi:Uma2 family endonuclease
MISMGAVTTNLMSLEEFERLDTTDQVELLKGELIRMPPAQYDHDESAERLFLLLNTALDRLPESSPDSPIGKVHHERGYLFPGHPPSWLKPDVSISHPGQLHRRYYEGAPLMVFEIVSEYDRAKDLEAKVAEYLANGAAEVWVIYPSKRHAWVYHSATRAAILETKSVHSDLLPGIEIPFTEFL